MAQVAPSAGYTLSIRVNLRNTPGRLGALTTAIGQAGGDIGAIDLVEHRGDVIVRDVTVKCRDERHGEGIVESIRAVDGVEVREVTDRTFEMHRTGKIAVVPKFPVRTRDDLSMAYTPGVARVSSAIAADRERAWDLTVKGNAVAVLSDGSAVLGLGNIGPEAAMPVMEGKAMLFKEFGGVDAYPMCIRTGGGDWHARAERLVEVGRAIAPGFGGINLEDIAAPVCFEVEGRLARELDIPVFHDDQHGTAIVVLAALLNASRVVGRPLDSMRAAVMGVGAAGVACIKLLLQVGIGDVVAVDRQGILSPVRTAQGTNPWKRWVARHTNRDRVAGGIDGALKGADVFIGVSGPGLIGTEQLATMADGAIVFALSNPVPEIMPEEVPPNVRVVATGRSDYPNQINNVLAFPGVFRGLLDSRARTVTDGMKVGAAEAIAGVVGDAELSEEYVVPSVFDRRVAPLVAQAVQREAGST
jgi:malate dehydrogenase (oxaloacetate-decarboxylating)